MNRRLTFLFALAGGAAVGTLYLAQPLLDLIARDFHASSTVAGWLVTATQIGYAAGVLLIVPLGDVLDRKLLIPAMMLGSAAALLLCALAPTIEILLLTITLVGLTTVAGQILVPLAGDLADEADRGQVVGTVVSGILTGILASRTISGLVAGVAGWRVLYLVAGAVIAVLAVLLYRAIPPFEPKTQLAYPALIASIGTVVLRERTVRWTLALAAIGFAAFTMFWTSLTFLLSGPPFEYPVSVIGLFGLAGLAGAIAAQRVGRLHDRGWSLPVTGAAWGLVLVTFILGGFGSHSVVAVLIMVVILDVALQTVMILNQLRVLAVSAQARSRLNTAFVTNNFIGGAIGSGLATILWPAGGWRAIMLAGAALSLLALTIWAAGRRTALVPEADPGLA